MSYTTAHVLFLDFFLSFQTTESDSHKYGSDSGFSQVDLARYFAKIASCRRSIVSGGSSVPWKGFCGSCLGPPKRCKDSPVAQVVSEKLCEGVWSLGRCVENLLRTWVMRTFKLVNVHLGINFLIKHEIF